MSCAQCCVLHGEGRVSPATPRNQNNEKPSRGQPQGAVRAVLSRAAACGGQSPPPAQQHQMLRLLHWRWTASIGAGAWIHGGVSGVMPRPSPRPSPSVQLTLICTHAEYQSSCLPLMSGFSLESMHQTKLQSSTAPIYAALQDH